MFGSLGEHQSRTESSQFGGRALIVAYLEKEKELIVRQESQMPKSYIDAAKSFKGSGSKIKLLNLRVRES